MFSSDVDFIDCTEASNKLLFIRPSESSSPADSLDQVVHRQQLKVELDEMLKSLVKLYNCFKYVKITWRWLSQDQPSPRVSHQVRDL
jgi:hypothetical protein